MVQRAFESLRRPRRFRIIILLQGQNHSLYAEDPVLKIQELWDVCSCRLVKSHRRFEGQCDLQLYTQEDLNLHRHRHKNLKYTSDSS